MDDFACSVDSIAFDVRELAEVMSLQCRPFLHLMGGSLEVISTEGGFSERFSTSMTRRNSTLASRPLHLSSQWRDVIGCAFHNQSASEFTSFSSRSSATGMGTVHVTESKAKLTVNCSQARNQHRIQSK